MSFYPFLPSMEDRSYPMSSSNNLNNIRDKAELSSKSKVNYTNYDNNNSFYDSILITPSSTANANNRNFNPRQAYQRRRLLSEQALRSRLSMMDRNTLLEEFLRFFQFYYSDHNQNGDNQDLGGGQSNQVESSKKREDIRMTSVDNIPNNGNHLASSLETSPSNKFLLSVDNGHNKNNYNNKYPVESRESSDPMVWDGGDY